MANAESTQNVLEMMTSQIMNRKVEKARKLTPTTGETVPTHTAVLPQTSARFPNDLPAEAILASVSSIEREVAHILEALAAVKAELQAKDAVKIVDLDAERKSREKAADEKIAEANAAIAASETVDDAVEEVARFNKEFKAKSEAAQAATFTEDTGWKCPTHGLFIVKKSRLGREFRSCSDPTCKEFERL